MVSLNKETSVNQLKKNHNSVKSNVESTANY